MKKRMFPGTGKPEANRLRLCRDAKCCVSTFIALVSLIALILAILMAPMALEAKTKKTKREASRMSAAGQDPRAFADAEALFQRKAAGTLSDIETVQLLDSLQKLIAEGILPEGKDNRAGAALITLNGSRMPDYLYKRIEEMARKVADTIDSRAAGVPSQVHALFAKGNKAYERGNFADAVAQYKEVLRRLPGHLDARNNLALCHLHRGSDFAALYHLEVLLHLDANYHGGRLNLSVVLARLGLNSEAFLLAKKLAADNPDFLLANYNLAWFENARGDGTAAQKAAKPAIDKAADYKKAKILYALNALESGSIPASQYTEAMSSQDKQRISKLKIDRVTVGSERAAVYDADQVVSRAKKGERYVISEKSGDWYAVYKPVDGSKRRLWLHKDDCTTKTVTTSPAATTASTGTGVLPAHFVGTWSEKWANVHNQKNITISSVNGKPRVSMKRNWRVWDVKYADGALSFRKKGGDSNWEFTYTLKPTSSGKLALTVYRIHDRKTFHGTFYTDGAAVKAKTTTSKRTLPGTASTSSPLPKRFVGTWSEKWADVHNKKNITISNENGKPTVKLTGNWQVWDEKYENGALSFRKKGGGSNWEFKYTIKQRTSWSMDLTVYRIHDQKTFKGKLYK